MPFENFSRVELIRYIRSSQFQDCQEPSISQMLRSGRKNKSTDPRDLVYALLGLYETSTPVLPIVNYSLSVQEVYEETVVACLSSSDPFTILSLAPADGFSSLKLPSWVPDFSALPLKVSGAYSYILELVVFVKAVFLRALNPTWKERAKMSSQRMGKLLVISRNRKFGQSSLRTA